MGFSYFASIIYRAKMEKEFKIYSENNRKNYSIYEKFKRKGYFCR